MFHVAPGTKRDDPQVPATGRLSLWRWIAPFLVLALLMRLIPLALGGFAEPENPDEAQADPMGQLGQRFPGSAYFYAEGALEPKANANGLPAQWRGNRHILPIDVGPSAVPYRYEGRTALDRVRALSCLTSAIYYEAANEPDEGQRAVGQVVLNRLRHPGWPNTVCGVVYEGTERADLRCQFTFSCDGSMARIPLGEKWSRARRVAERALKGEVFAPVGLSTFYHTLSVFPSWAGRMQAAAIIGAHIFYRAPGAEGAPSKFVDRYAGVETVGGPSEHAYLDPRDAAVAPVAAPLVTAAMPAASGAPAQSQPAPPPTSSVTLPESWIKPEFANSGAALNP